MKINIPKEENRVSIYSLYPGDVFKSVDEDYYVIIHNYGCLVGLNLRTYVWYNLNMFPGHVVKYEAEVKITRMGVNN